MISEEEYHNGVSPMRSQGRNDYNNKTTNENIMEYQYNLEKSKKHTVDEHKSNDYVPKSQISPNIQKFLQYQNSIEEENDDIRTDQSEYDKSVSVRKGRFNFKTIKHAYVNENDVNGYNVDLNSDNVRYLRPISQMENRTPSDYNLNYNYSLHPMQQRQSVTEYSLKERSETGTARNLFPFMNDVNMNMMRDDNLYLHSKSDVMRTPMFTNSNINPQVFYPNKLPPLISEMHSNRESSKDNESEKNRNMIHYSNKEVKGSPWNSDYFDCKVAQNNRTSQATSEARQQISREKESNRFEAPQNVEFNQLREHQVLPMQCKSLAGLGRDCL